jgi:hypothetical protein
MLLRQFCICGREYEDGEDFCPICRNTVSFTIVEDEYRPRTKSGKRAKRHESDCECSVCEAHGTHLRELNFDD